MSATLQSNLFSRYFSVPVQGQLQGAPVIPVEGKIFPVKEVYLDHLTSLGQVLTFIWCKRISYIDTQENTLINKPYL